MRIAAALLTVGNPINIRYLHGGIPGTVSLSVFARGQGSREA
jgi:hypothetical protein